MKRSYNQIEDKSSYEKYVKIPRVKEYTFINSLSNKIETFGSATKKEIERDILYKKNNGETYWSNILCTGDIDKDLDVFFRDFQDVKNIAIDGPSSLGKTTLIASNTNAEIGQYTDVSKVYNFNPLATYTYINANRIMATEFNGVVFDRSIISNFAYGICYYLMSIVTNDQCGYRSFSSMCEEYVNVTNTRPMLEYINSLNLSVFVLLDSDYEKYAKRMNARGYKTHSASDQVKSLSKEYWLCQHAAFAYLANILNFKCLDYNYLRTYYAVDESDLMTIVQKKFLDNYTSSDFKNYINLSYQKTRNNVPEIETLFSSIFVYSKR